MSDFERDRREILESAEKVLNKAHVIDCSLADNLTAEFGRLCGSHKLCCNCELFRSEKYEPCINLMRNKPKEFIEIVQAWSDTHPKEKVVTYLDKLLEVFPNVPLDSTTTPDGFCPSDLGLKEIADCFPFRVCKECWNQPYKENTNGQD